MSDTNLQKARARKERMLGAEAIIRSLEAEDVTICWGIPGGAILPLYDAFMAIDHSIEHVLVRHEQGAGHMAQGYARATGKVGVCIATSGPGATNLVTPIADAFLDSTPLVAITGQVPTHLIGTDAFQEADITGIVMPIVKHSFLVQKAEDIPKAIHEAFHIASTGRPGPVLVDIPKDLQLTEIDFAYVDTIDLVGYSPEFPRELEGIEAAADLIAHSRKPVLYVGGGVINGEASDDLILLAEAMQVPVTTTLLAKGAFPDSHPLSVQMPGMHGSKYANWTIHRSDLLITVGARFDDRVTGKLDAFAPGAKIIHFDIDPAEVSKNRFADVSLVGELRATLPALRDAVIARKDNAARLEAQGEWLRDVQSWKRDNPFRYKKGDKLKPQYVVEAFDKALKGKDAIWVTGVGQHQMWAAQFLSIDGPRRWLTSGGLGTMGFGVPAAIGAQQGCPDAYVVNFDGDGCFQMTMQELATARCYDVPAIHAVMNNGWLGMVRQWQELFHGERYSETNLFGTIPDFVKLAEAYGVLALRAETEAEVDAVVAEAIAARRPTVIDFRIDEEEKVYPMVPSGAASHEMIDQAWDNEWVEEGV
ncbi:MAG: biosynthetic-type acetolactate synthase large subunit [Actinobacteria bacterium]|nr:biosynthetic-type acetolactate synthase large subunit [Actinomycetota bacterium]